MGLEFKNNLNVPVKVYFFKKNGDEMNIRGAGANAESYSFEHHVQADGGTLPLELTGINKDFMIYIKMNDIPICNNVEGIKVIHGTGLSDLFNLECHHVEYHRKNDHYLAIMHIKKEQENNKDKTHRKLLRDYDPTIDHPDPPIETYF